MSFLEAILLGILQGLTEFLPVSSSGHLVLAQQFLGLKEPLVFFDVMLHVGTLAAVLVVYRDTIKQLVVGGLSEGIALGSRLLAFRNLGKSAQVVAVANDCNRQNDLLPADCRPLTVEEEDILVYYSFDKMSGNKVTDDSGNGNDAELVGKGSLVDGAFKKAIHLNGGVVQMAQNDFIVPIGEKGEITMEAWFYLNEHASYDGIISIEAAAQ